MDSNAKPHDVWLDGFLIDKTEVSNQAYRKFIEAGGYTSKELAGKSLWSDDGWAFISKSDRKEPGYWDDKRFNQDNYPVVGVSWYEAEAYCRFMDRELPTEAQWDKAAGDLKATSGRLATIRTKSIQKPTVAATKTATNLSRP